MVWTLIVRFYPETLRDAAPYRQVQCRTDGMVVNLV
jgi:hypothetical protein